MPITIRHIVCEAEVEVNHWDQKISHHDLPLTWIRKDYILNRSDGYSRLALSVFSGIPAEFVSLKHRVMDRFNCLVFSCTTRHTNAV